MKLRNLISLLVLNFALFSQQNAQTINNSQTIAILSMDAHGFSIDPPQMRSLASIELSKLNMYEVIDNHEIDYIMEENKINPVNCFNKACLIDVGEKLKAEKVLTGSIEVLGNNIVVTFRLIDVRMESVIKTEVMEFLNYPNHVHSMIKLTLQKMFNQKTDNELMKKLTQQYDYESEVIAPTTDNIKLNGPRMGITIFSGDLANAYQVKKEYGGYDVSSVMMQFGYQFEVRYLSVGDFQALFEFTPIVTGLDQGLFIPSFSFLHGLRSNKTGFEVAFGPILNMVKMGKTPDGTTIPSPQGDPEIKVGFVFGIGKTFTSGRLNFPVNAFFLPGKSGHRYGISVGFNMRSYEDKQ